MLIGTRHFDFGSISLGATIRRSRRVNACFLKPARSELHGNGKQYQNQYRQSKIRSFCHNPENLQRYDHSKWLVVQNLAAFVESGIKLLDIKYIYEKTCPLESTRIFQRR
jgi:hypothetical protein